MEKSATSKQSREAFNSRSRAIQLKKSSVPSKKETQQTSSDVVNVKSSSILATDMNPSAKVSPGWGSLLGGAFSIVKGASISLLNGFSKRAPGPTPPQPMNNVRDMSSKLVDNDFLVRSRALQLAKAAAERQARRQAGAAAAAAALPAPSSKTARARRVLGAAFGKLRGASVTLLQGWKKSPPSSPAATSPATAAAAAALPVPAGAAVGEEAGFLGGDDMPDTRAPRRAFAGPTIVLVGGEEKDDEEIWAKVSGENYLAALEARKVGPHQAFML